MENKFSAGDIVYHKGSKEPLVVLETVYSHLDGSEMSGYMLLCRRPDYSLVKVFTFEVEKPASISVSVPLKDLEFPPAKPPYTVTLEDKNV